jgi:hypothetical protein
MIYNCRDNNLTPSLFCRCTTVVRLPQKRAPGQPLVFTAPGKYESAPVVKNMEVAVAAGGGGGDGDDDSSSRDSASMAEDIEVAAAAGGEGGHSQDDVSSRADRKRKAPCGPIKFTG